VEYPLAYRSIVEPAVSGLLGGGLAGLFSLRRLCGRSEVASWLVCSTYLGWMSEFVD